MNWNDHFMRSYDTELAFHNAAMCINMIKRDSNHGIETRKDGNDLDEEEFRCKIPITQMAGLEDYAHDIIVIHDRRYFPPAQHQAE